MRRCASPGGSSLKAKPARLVRRRVLSCLVATSVTCVCFAVLDAHFSYVKAKTTRYVDNGEDIWSPNDIFLALVKAPLKNTSVMLVDTVRVVDGAPNRGPVGKINDIKSFHDFEFGNGSARVRSFIDIEPSVLRKIPAVPTEHLLHRVVKCQVDGLPGVEGDVQLTPAVCLPCVRRTVSRSVCAGEVAGAERHNPIALLQSSGCRRTSARSRGAAGARSSTRPGRQGVRSVRRLLCPAASAHEGVPRA